MNSTKPSLNNKSKPVFLLKSKLFSCSLLLGATMVLMTSPARAAIFIDFDTDADNDPLNATNMFAGTTALTNLYSSLGVTFSGPGGDDGGAILNETSNFGGLDALSSPNFLAFNPLATLSDGGTPIGPETITLAASADNVSLFVAGGDSAKSFLLEGFNAADMLVASDTVTTQDFSELEVSSAGGLKSVVLSETSVDDDGDFVVDNLTIGGSVPEPSTWALLLGGFGVLAFLRLRTRRSVV